MSELKPTHYLADTIGIKWTNGDGCWTCSKLYSGKPAHDYCPRCRPDLWREIERDEDIQVHCLCGRVQPLTDFYPQFRERAKKEGICVRCSDKQWNIKPEPQCVWWWKYRDESWQKLMRMLFSDYDTPEKRSRAEDVLWHYGPRPPCEDGKHAACFEYVGGKVIDRCPRCHANLDNGESSVQACDSRKPVNPESRTTRTVKPESPPIHQDPLRFRGHSRGCQQWLRVDYKFCSCFRTDECRRLEFDYTTDCKIIEGLEMVKGQPTNPSCWPQEFTPRLSDWDL